MKFQIWCSDTIIKYTCNYDQYAGTLHVHTHNSNCRGTFLNLLHTCVTKNKSTSCNNPHLLIKIRFHMLHVLQCLLLSFHYVVLFLPFVFSYTLL